MPFAAFLYEVPKPFLIAGMVLGFVWFWPVGLIILATLIATGRLGRGCGRGRWYAAPDGSAGKWGWSPRNASPYAPPPGGNSAFDEYRAETLRRLEEEQKEFVEYLDRLRRARDKAEFDAFMADRRRVNPVDEHGNPQ